MLLEFWLRTCISKSRGVHEGALNTQATPPQRLPCMRIEHEHMRQGNQFDVSSLRNIAEHIC